jgi:hypothetical protein
VVRPPALLVSPTVLAFSGIQGAGLAPQTVALSHEAGDAVSFTATPSAAWIRIDPPSGTTPSTIDVGVDAAGLSTGTHTGSVTFVAGGQSVTMGLSLQLRAPTLITSQGALAFSGIQGGAIAAQPVIVSLDSGVAAHFVATASAPWIVVTPAAGTTPSETSIGIETSALAPGDHVGSVTFRSGAQTATVAVALRLRAPALVTSKASVAFSGSSAAPFATQVVDVSLDSGVAAGFTATASAPWIVVTPVAATTPASVNIGIASAGLATGAHTGFVTFTSGGLTAKVPVSLDVRAPSLRAYAGENYWDTSFRFSGVQGKSIPTQPLRVFLDTAESLPFTVAKDAEWLTVDKTSGVTPDRVTVGVMVAGFAPGRYTATITVSTAVETITVPVTLDISAPILWATPPPFGSVIVGGVLGGQMGTATLDIGTTSSAPAAFTVTPSTGWIVVSPACGQTPAQLSITVDQSVGPLAVGTYAGTVKIEAIFEGKPLQPVVVPVTANVFRPTMHVLYGGARFVGGTLDPEVIPFWINTGANAYPWTATASQPWITLPVVSGTVSDTSTNSRVVVAPNITDLAPGTHTGEVEITVNVLGELIRQTVPITLELNPHELRVPTRGVALTSMPGASRLARTIRVQDDRGEPVAWSAVSDQPWLTVTPSGTTPAGLVITAAPYGLSAGTLHFARVTVSSTAPGVENVETVRVGLWVGDAPSGPAVEVAGAYQELVADPVRPWVYVHDGGTDILAVDVHTGATVATFAGVGTALAGMAVSGDGSTLWAVDRGTWTVVPIDLDFQTIGTGWSTWSGVPYPRLVWLRAEGHELLATSDGWLREAQTGALLTDWPRPGYAAWPTASAEGNAFCIARCYTVVHSEFGEWPWYVQARSAYSGPLDAALSADGATVYEPTSYGNTWVGTDTLTNVETFRANGAWPTPTSVEIGWDGRLYGGRSAAPDGEPDVLVFDTTGAQLGALTFHEGTEELLPGRLVLSADGLRVVAITAAPADGAGHLKALPAP